MRTGNKLVEGLENYGEVTVYDIICQSGKSKVNRMNGSRLIGTVLVPSTHPGSSPTKIRGVSGVLVVSYDGGETWEVL